MYFSCVKVTVIDTANANIKMILKQQQITFRMCTVILVWTLSMASHRFANNPAR